MAAPPSVTELLRGWRAGKQSCLDRLIPLIQGELREIAHRYMARERIDHTLQTTALVNEAYLRLVDTAPVDWHNRAHFFGVAAQLMRHILVDHARGRCRDKRGGGVEFLPLNEGLAIATNKSAALVALDDALSELAKFDPRKARVVELRYFGGLDVKETAEVLGIHPNTVINDWRMAKGWLKREIDRGAARDAG